MTTSDKTRAALAALREKAERLNDAYDRQSGGKRWADSGRKLIYSMTQLAPEFGNEYAFLDGHAAATRVGWNIYAQFAPQGGYYWRVGAAMADQPNRCAVGTPILTRDELQELCDGDIRLGQYKAAFELVAGSIPVASTGVGCGTYTFVLPQPAPPGGYYKLDPKHADVLPLLHAALDARLRGLNAQLTGGEKRRQLLDEYRLLFAEGEASKWSAERAQAEDEWVRRVLDEKAAWVADRQAALEAEAKAREEDAAAEAEAKAREEDAAAEAEADAAQLRAIHTRQARRVLDEKAAWVADRQAALEAEAKAREEDAAAEAEADAAQLRAIHTRQARRAARLLL